MIDVMSVVKRDIMFMIVIVIVGEEEVGYGLDYIFDLEEGDIFVYVVGVGDEG